MNGAFYIGAVGLDAQQRALEVVANNIANINTNGFKRSAVQFSELTAPAFAGSDQVMAGQTASLAGVALNAAPHVWTQGDLKQTGQQLDLAINGDGFFELLGPSGRSLLWRGGTLRVNPDGYLAASNGMMLRDMVSVPQGTSTLTIDSAGVVSALVSGDAKPQTIGQLSIAAVKETDSLTDLGGGLFEAGDASDISTVQPGQDGAGTVVQGSLEAANVQLSDEMVTLLLLQRAFAANAQVVQAGDQLMAIANGLRR